MTSPAANAKWSFACRDAGFPCEWQLRAASTTEIEARFREHARCAHGLRELPPEIVALVASVSRSA